MQFELGTSLNDTSKDVQYKQGSVVQASKSSSLVDVRGSLLKSTF